MNDESLQETNNTHMGFCADVFAEVFDGSVCGSVWRKCVGWRLAVFAEMFGGSVSRKCFAEVIAQVFLFSRPHKGLKFAAHMNLY